MSQVDEEIAPLPADEHAAWLGAIDAALRPGELDAESNQRLVELALSDPLAPPSAEELAESARLREALEGNAAHEDIELLQALRAPFQAAPERAPNASALAAALAAPAAKPRPRNVVYVTFGAGSLLLAAAAAIALSFGALPREVPSGVVAKAEPIKPHSTTSMFDAPFDTAETTLRVDRIALSRERELRQNRYVAWGVR